jgi:hypothetical protein
MPGIRHLGMPEPVFQLETVEGGSSSSRATALVPPSAAMISDAFSISWNYDNRN